MTEEVKETPATADTQQRVKHTAVMNHPKSLKLKGITDLEESKSAGYVVKVHPGCHAWQSRRGVVKIRLRIDLDPSHRRRVFELLSKATKLARQAYPQMDQREYMQSRKLRQSANKLPISQPGVEFVLTCIGGSNFAEAIRALLGMGEHSANAQRIRIAYYRAGGRIIPHLKVTHTPLDEVRQEEDTLRVFILGKLEPGCSQEHNINVSAEELKILDIGK